MQATLLAGSLGPPLRFRVRVDPVHSLVEVRNDGDGPAITGASLIEPDELVARRGLEALDLGAVQLAVEAEMIRLWETPLRLVLLAAGFAEPPRVRRARSGRKPLLRAVLAVRTRHLLDDERRPAGAEKTFTAARDAGLLHRPLRGREWTADGLALLAQCDAAAERLLELLADISTPVPLVKWGPFLVPPFSVAVVNAAVEKLVLERRVDVTKYASADDRRVHGFAAAEIAARLASDRD